MYVATASGDEHWVQGFWGGQGLCSPVRDTPYTCTLARAAGVP